jgi:hypothetical protein
LPKDDFYTPTDIDALRMENELLTFEVRFLKTQFAEVEQLRSRLAKAEQLRSRLAKAERAEQDLVLLLRRLANSPLGWFFRRKEGFRVLERRYLDTDS